MVESITQVISMRQAITNVLPGGSRSLGSNRDLHKEKETTDTAGPQVSVGLGQRNGSQRLGLVPAQLLLSQQLFDSWTNTDAS